MSIQNYGDVTTILLAMVAQGSLGLFADEPIKDCPQASFSISLYECNAFFLEYAKMSKLHADGDISDNIFGTWLGAELAKLQSFSLPVSFIWPDGAWIAQSPQTQTEEGSHGLNQETDN